MTRTRLAFLLGLGIGALGVMPFLYPHHTVMPWEICE